MPPRSVTLLVELFDAMSDQEGQTENMSPELKEPQALLVAGDIHGDPEHVIYLYERAINNDVDAIFSLGDFGFWEHDPRGGAFLDFVSELATINNMPLYWIDGNHESHTLLRAKYGPGGPEHRPTPEGFWEIRPSVYYVPRGTRWVWQGRHLMGLGGAYSVDKALRLAREGGYVCRSWGWTERHVERFGATGPRTQWWPEEELTDEELSKALADPTPLDILFTHDKPRASNPRWNRKDQIECYPNQDRIQTVVQTLTPRLLVHGHLHFAYEDEIRAKDDKVTWVLGLDCNPDKTDWKGNSRPQAEFEKQQQDSWIRLSLLSE